MQFFVIFSARFPIDGEAAPSVMPLPKQPRRRRLLSLIIATIFGVLGTTTLSVCWMWHVMMADDIVQGTSPVKVSATSILKSEATSRTITAMFGSPVRAMALR